MRPVRLFTTFGKLVFVLQVYLMVILGIALSQDVIGQDMQVTKADYEYLQHYTVLNVFDSVSVSYVVGEFRVGNGSAERRVPLDTLLKTDATLVNSGGEGSQSVLSAVLRTKPVTIDTSDTYIRFHRELRARAVDPQTLQSTSAWKFDDRSEFLLHIVRASDDVVLYTIDSVGIDSTSSYQSGQTPLFGTQVAQWCRDVAIPGGLAGTAVYFRIEPRQYGSCDYGMSAGRTALRLSRAIMYGCNPMSQTDDAITLYDSVRFAMILQDKLTELATTCKITAFDYLELTDQQGDSLLHSLFTLDTSYYNASGLRRMIPRQCEQAKTTLARSGQSRQSISVQQVGPDVRFRPSHGPSHIVISWFDSRGALVVSQSVIQVVQPFTSVPIPTTVSVGPLYMRWYAAEHGLYGALSVLRQ